MHRVNVQLHPLSSTAETGGTMQGLGPHLEIGDSAYAHGPGPCDERKQPREPQAAAKFMHHARSKAHLG